MHYLDVESVYRLLRVSLIAGLLITGLDWTGILKFVFTPCDM